MVSAGAVVVLDAVAVAADAAADALLFTCIARILICSIAYCSSACVCAS